MIALTKRGSPQTEQLFWKDAYCKEFEAKILEITSKELVLDKTAFYPSGGGQASDQGFIFNKNDLKQKIKVTSVENIEGKIVHYITGKGFDKLQKNDIIVGKIDWERRYTLMQAHTSQHILSAFIVDLCKVQTTKALIEVDDVTIYLERKLSDEELKLVLSKTNDFLISNNMIHSELFARKELPKELIKSLRGDLASIENHAIRVVTVDGLDNSLCGGTHCNNTSEIGILVLNDFKGDMINYSHGKSALGKIAKMNIALISTAKLLASKPTEVEVRMKKTISELKEFKETNALLSKIAVEYKLLEAKNNPIELGKIKIYHENFHYAERKFVLQQLGPVPENTIAIFIVKGPLLLVLSEVTSLPANEIVSWYCEQVKTKGGGSVKIAQAAITDMDIAIQTVITLLEGKMKENGN